MKRNWKLISLGLMLICSQTTLGQLRESKYGYSFPTEGVVKTMVVFAEYSDTMPTTIFHLHFLKTMHHFILGTIT